MEKLTRQEQVSFFAAEDAINKLTLAEATNAQLAKTVSACTLENAETKMLKVPGCCCCCCYLLPLLMMLMLLLLLK